ncbi:hypothetical protein EJP77_01310 [Paenibacillus zeisoli]|uniref:Uncharacterized protein n=1 Tax=Paenibacillus zeisoli TaxID=2496267 RepID=A0A3S1D9D8_9BACL|nr:hypothetical protein [Paenibacillus zeisoli]RUT35685.1 hypothetical protein EJP77_01310 [Paenibacillus zeisoli]
MADVHIVDERTIKITADIQDALHMIQEAKSNVPKYAQDIVTIFEKMPEFDYTYFCFYAYNSAMLFENMLGIDPKNYTSFSMNAPDAFFHTLYGGMAALYEEASHFVVPLSE